jgi:C-terminal processing protease CtpA/Prc
LEKLNKHIGEFVSLDSSSVDIEKFDTIYPYPKNVGIIINENNGSTTEQFLLSAKQSKKVKLFGTTTRGVLDISNMYFINSPCNDLKLGYSLSRSKRIPDMTIDNRGIQPDYYIDKTISKYEWIDFVNKILNNQ